MKKLIIMIGLLLTNMALSETNSVIRTPVEGFTVAEGWDYVYDIKTPAFEKVQLDCQGIASGMQFYKDDAPINKIYIDNYECGTVSEYFMDSQTQGLPICLELDTQSNTLRISRETDECR
jgi:hypothetical protein